MSALYNNKGKKKYKNANKVKIIKFSGSLFLCIFLLTSRWRKKERLVIKGINLFHGHSIRLNWKIAVVRIRHINPCSYCKIINFAVIMP